MQSEGRPTQPARVRESLWRSRELKAKEDFSGTKSTAHGGEGKHKMKKR